jgi:hypothetical protein
LITPKDLLADLQKQLRGLERDLLTRAESDAEIDTRLRQRYSDAVTRSRTGLNFETWRGQQLTQMAAGWVLACVYTRFCEDNGLLGQPMLAGPGNRLAEARERQTDYFRHHPEESDLDYLRASVGRLEEYDATRALVDRHNPMHLAAPSPDVATGLLEFWRRINPATGTLVHDFTDQHLGTRFLGDLYQDLSEQARADYALFQTPEFIEEFILDRTLDPAIDEYSLAEVRLIDPACGSGHFLLGAFARLLGGWRQQEPGTNVRVLVERALGQVHGVDINPYAAAIARFRLVVAALNACRISRLADAPAWKIRVAIGDSLRFGVRYGQDVIAGVTERAMTGIAGAGEFVYEYEDAAELQAILGQRYHAVVANPPYPTVKDPTLNRLYRELWSACSGKYALSVPFAQRLFDISIHGGFVGQITSNSFMKREFGKKLIEQFFSLVDLNLVIDTSGAYIPGHGTPTVIICGRNRRPVSRTVRAVLGIRSEPIAPADPAKGLVWTSIVDYVDRPGATTEYVSVTDMPRDRLATHPWSLSGGGADDLIQIIVGNGSNRLGERASRIGVFGMTNADDVMLASPQSWQRRTGSLARVRRAVTGEEVRDWKVEPGLFAFFPYDSEFHLVRLADDPRYLHWLWPCRTILGNRATFSKATYFAEGRPWYEWHQITLDPNAHRWTIAWAEIATHNHFILDRGGKVFKQTSPVMKLPALASENEHMQLLGLLNSSAACFWLRQVSHNKGRPGAESAGADEPWEHRYAFNASKLEQFPLPTGGRTELAARLDGLAADLERANPAAIAADGVPTRAGLEAARAEWERIRGEMISAQEELDWEVYDLYGLLGDNSAQLIRPQIKKPLLHLGERAFEIALARKLAAGEVETEWFARHRSIPITELPNHWSEEYRALVDRRLTTIAEDPYIHLIERSECKRRWASPTWEEMEANALEDWLLDRLEESSLWFQSGPSLQSVAQLAGALRTNADFVSVAGLFARDADLDGVVAALVKDQNVPFLATLRYAESGMSVHAQWEKTWELQRREDTGTKVGNISVPPKYKKEDFQDPVYWHNRGKLDVPKERFISYPGLSRDGTLLLGWAGWDQLQQAQALTAYINERRELDAWGPERLTPLLAGLAELLPWVTQWYRDVDPEFGVRPAEAYSGFLDEQLLQLGLTRGDLTAWRPQPPTRGRRRTT